jgi:hypothetical protein
VPNDPRRLLLGRKQRLQRVIVLGDQALRPREIDQVRDQTLDREMADVDPGRRVDHLRDVAQIERGPACSRL